jgi:lysophospholipase L1-like esterase
LLAEGVLRAFDIGPSIQVIFEESYQLSDNPVLEYELRPLARDGDIQINSAGFRDREFSRVKPPDVFRIAAIGDSITFGLWLPHAESYAKQLEALLNHRAPPTGSQFEILNFGVPGYNITQVVERLGLALEYDPDLIIYGYVLNDPQDESLEGETLRQLHALEHERLRERFGRGMMRWLSGSRLFMLSWLAYSQQGPHVASYARNGSTAQLHDRTRDVDLELPAKTDAGRLAYDAGDTRGEYFRSLHWSPASRQRFERGFEELERVTHDAQVPVVVCIFPLFFRNSVSSYPLADVHALVRDEVLDRRMSVLDLLPAFASAEQRFGKARSFAADFIHPNAFGQQIAAFELLTWLNTSARSERASRSSARQP